MLNMEKNNPPLLKKDDSLKGKVERNLFYFDFREEFFI